MPEAEESLRLEQYVTDLSLANDGLQSKLESYDPASICRVFYMRVFNNPDPQAPYGEEAEKIVKYKGKVVTYRELYLYLLGEINDLVAYMTAPVGQKTLQKLVPNRSAVKNGDPGTLTLMGGDTARDISLSTSHLAKSFGWERQLRFQPRHQPFHQQAQQQLAHVEDYRFGEQLGNLNKPAGAESTNFMSAFVDPSSCNITIGDLTGHTNAQLRSQTRFGNPATAQFNPVSTIDDVDFGPGQNLALSTQDTHTPADSNPLFSRSGQSFHANAPLAYHQAGDGPGTSQPDLARSTNLNTTGTAQHPNTVRSSIVAATNAQGGNAIPSGSIPLHADLQDGYTQGLQGQSFSAQAHLADCSGHQLHSSSPGSGPQRSLLKAPIQIPQSYTQNQAQLLLQTQGRIQLSTRAQAQIPHQTKSLGQAQDLSGQAHPLDAHAFTFNVPEQQISGQALGYNAPTYPFVASSQTLGARAGELPSSDQNTLNRIRAAQYQHQLNQSLPQHQSYQQRTYGNMYDGGMLTGTIAGQPNKYAPGVGFQPHVQYGAAPGLAAQTFVQPYIPADKYARAPAPNRIASRFAQANAFQSIQPKLVMNNSAMQTRFSTPVQSLRTNLVTLPYRAGSDKMFPNQSDGIASVRYQDLTRNEPPRFAVAGDENYVPFVNTTKLSKPAEWGVLKVSNVSIYG